jgi:hypothetical protein
MPVVTINPDEYEKFELKSAPRDPNVEGDEDGWINLRPLPYGMKLKIRDQSTKMFMRAKAPQRSGKGRMRVSNPEEDSVLEFETASEAANFLTFSYCIGGHNLMDSQRNQVDFTSPMSFKQLDPKVGSEIEVLIDELNRGEDEESFEDFMNRSSESSEETEKVSQVDTGEMETAQNHVLLRGNK